MKFGKKASSRYSQGILFVDEKGTYRSYDFEPVTGDEATPQSMTFNGQPLLT